MMASISTRRGRVGLVLGLVCMGMVLLAALSGPGNARGEDLRLSETNKDLQELKEIKEACVRMRTKFQKRLEAAMRAMVQACLKGAPIEAAEAMAAAGLEQGVEADDFQSLGEFLNRQHAKGLKGEALTQAINAEINRRKAESIMLLQAEVERKRIMLRLAKAGSKSKEPVECAACDQSERKFDKHNIVYLVDRSGSMFDMINAVKNDILNSAKVLDPIQNFHVIMLADGDPLEKKPMFLTPSIEKHKIALAGFLANTRAEGRTNPVKGINRAFDTLAKMKKCPGKVINLLTDGTFPDNQAVFMAIRARNRKKDVMINTFLIGKKTPIAVKVMQQIAKENGGKYRYVNPNE